MEATSPNAIATLLRVVLVGFVLVLVAIVALVRSGRTIPPFGGDPRRTLPRRGGSGNRSAGVHDGGDRGARGAAGRPPGPRAEAPTRR